MYILDIAGCSYYAEPGEEVVAIVPDSSGKFLGLVTSRPNGLFYASVCSRAVYGDVCEWGSAPTTLDRSIFVSANEAEELVRNVMAGHLP
jgi:hypothetical protein